MKIKIFTHNIDGNHILYANEKKREVVLLDTKETSYDVDRFVYKITDMVSNWPNELEDQLVIDGQEFKIIIKNHDEEVMFRFVNKFPEDIYKLQDIINEILKENLND